MPDTPPKEGTMTEFKIVAVLTLAVLMLIIYFYKIEVLKKDDMFSNLSIQMWGLEFILLSVTLRNTYEIMNGRKPWTMSNISL